MNIRALRDYRWFSDDDGYQSGNTYDVEDKLASQMILHGYAKKVGAIAKAIASSFGSSNDTQEFENKMIDVTYKKRGRPRKED